MKWTTIAIVGGVLIIVLGIVGSLYLPRLLAPVRGETERIVITTTGAYRIQGYEHFYDLEEQVEALDQRLAAYPDELSPRQQTDCIGILSVRADRVAEYNAASRAELTTGKWRADNLPERLAHEAPRSC